MRVLSLRARRGFFHWRRVCSCRRRARFTGVLFSQLRRRQGRHRCRARARRRRLAGADRRLPKLRVRVPVSHARPQQIVEHAIVPIQRATPVHLLDAAQGMPRDELPVQMRDARALVAPRTPRLRHAGIPLHRPVQLPAPRLCLQARLRQRVSRRPRARLPRERPHHLSGEDATYPPTSRNNGFETSGGTGFAGGWSK